MQIVVGTERVDPSCSGNSVATLAEAGRIEGRKVHETFREQKDVSGLEERLNTMLGPKNIDRFGKKFPGTWVD